MTPVCEQLTRPDWLDEDRTDLSLASDSSVLGALWLADQWRFTRPDESTEFWCEPSNPGLYRLVQPLPTPVTTPHSATWDPGVEGGTFSTMFVGTSVLPWAGTFVIADPSSSRRFTAYIPYNGVTVYGPPFPAAVAAALPQEVSAAVAVPVQETAANSKSRPAPRPSPLDIIIDLKDSLDLTWDDAERATGIDRNTLLNWQRTGPVPRPSTMRKLMRVHGLLASLRSTLGDDQATAWLQEGDPRPVDVLKRGGLKAFTAAVTAVIDGEGRRKAAEFGYRPGPEEEEEAPLPPRVEFKSSQRRATRSRLPEDDD